jgi:hypothetical protein
MICDFCAAEVPEILDVPYIGRSVCLCRKCWGQYGYVPQREKRKPLERPRPPARQLLLFDLGRNCHDQL